jgi:hypothetical protein
MRHTKQRFCVNGHNRTFPGALYANGDCIKCQQMTLKWKRHLKIMYNISAEEYSQLLDDQNGGCVICGVTPEKPGGKLAVEHDRSCCPGKRCCGMCVTGLLCADCCAVSVTEKERTGNMDNNLQEDRETTQMGQNPVGQVEIVCSGGLTLGKIGVE